LGSVNAMGSASAGRQRANCLSKVSVTGRVFERSLART
jgi:hypothetical protein